MANQSKRLLTNVEGNFFVDSTCINCDTCRQLAPTTFVEKGDYSSVFHQPESAIEELAAYQARIACPVGSIGTVKKNPTVLSKAQATFPLHLDGGVSYAGFNSEKSFGANSYFIEHPDGNWLIDSPRFLKHLVEAFKRLGGIRYIFLSHEDDVADAALYSKTFGATRIIHRSDAHAVADAEWILDGEDSVQAGPEFTFIPAPGHTAGSMAMLYKNRFLFSGDHVWWDRELQQLGAPERLVWDVTKLQQSIAKLLDYSFEWLLPGHGNRVHMSTQEMRSHLLQLVSRRSN